MTGQLYGGEWQTAKAQGKRQEAKGKSGRRGTASLSSIAGDGKQHGPHPIRMRAVLFSVFTFALCLLPLAFCLLFLLFVVSLLNQQLVEFVDDFPGDLADDLVGH